MNRVIASVLLIGAAGLAHPQSSTTKSLQKPEPSAAIQDHEQRIQSLEAQIRLLQSRVASKYATLDCNGGKYDEFQATSGSLPFLAACTRIEPYLEGHKITLSVGNPHTFVFRNVRGTLYYGKESANQKVDVSFIEGLRSGGWNSATVIINPSKAEDLRVLYLELTAQTAGATQ